MKKIFTLFIGIVFSLTILNAQDAPPQAFSYKATIKKANGAIVASKTISLQISILQGSSNGTAVYSEVFHPTTNEYGQIDVEIGHGETVTGTFSTIPWSIAEYFLMTEIDVKGGRAYAVMSVTQLLSVPYSLYSGEAGNGFAEVYTPGEVRPVLSGEWGGKLSIGPPPANWPNVWARLSVAEVATIHAGSNPWGSALVLDASSLPGGIGTVIATTGGEAGEGAGKFFIRNSNSNLGQFVIDKNENIGIHTYNPAYTLDVAGDINFTGELYKNGSPLNFEISGQFYYADRDNDDYGDQYSPVWTPSGVEPPAHFINNSTDCNDNNASVHPDLPEIDDDIDNDCDGLIDEGIPVCSPGSTEYRSCGGGVGVCFKSGTQTRICGPEGFWSDWSICEGETLPSSEICDSKDNDCDGQIDEDATCPDGQCIAGVCVKVDNDGDGYSVSEGDCDDYNALIKPGAIEVFNHMDDNCNGIVDEGFVCTPSSYEPNESCNQSFYLGEVVDTYGEFITRTGNVTDPYDVDWFRVLATDASDFLSESFIVRINLISNPGSAYAFDVYKSDCSHPVAYSVTEYVEDGTFGMEDTNSYYIKVYLKYPSYPRNCDTYTIRMSNGEE